MNNTQRTYSRKFGQFQVNVTGSDISICSDLHGSNFGHFYPFAFERFKSHDKTEAGDWDRPQVLGMDWDLGLASPKSPLRGWLYGLIYSGKLDHLVES